ncbi:hypothetical protein P152DRAFT_74063 [Eremomyces bilateralis CBS 781.70]|uniref:Uncharacterized protein n=1 Tax=Eremomyces bilateralis CBS 781.70 TaxID=1392243 RepID=A0A6G1FZB2_9PEZI|nr:uncharacterized protein P152DRAFT_74063 [Eremomyces bilateralis CBS 781.70]KAF1811016.1 hypothetical protein P152DRAFT_74063 [Eremomyces bilateralis CBS 781.70]
MSRIECSLQVVNRAELDQYEYKALSCAWGDDDPFGQNKCRVSAAGKSMKPPVADYEKDVSDVYIEFVKHCVDKTGRLDTICRHWPLPIKKPRSRGVSKKGHRVREPVAVYEPMPSWIGMLKDSAYGSPGKYTGRRNGDSLVGRPFKRVYTASKGHDADCFFEETQMLEDQLTVQLNGTETNRTTSKSPQDTGEVNSN